MAMSVKIRHSGKCVGRMVRTPRVYAVRFGAHHVLPVLHVVRSGMIGLATGSYHRSHRSPEESAEWEMSAKPVRQPTRAVSSAPNLE
jgi:hypothetical protein